ncbi:MAG: DUF1269 domain-containing protein [Nitrospirae bacterium]|nr:MAG: DUF1269 domain-containing protein [Nitrospirota bacterium]
MAKQTLICVYDTVTKVEDALHKLKENDFPIKKVSVLSKDMKSGKKIHGYINVGTEAGTWVGGIFGLLVGAAFIWLPGVGLVTIAGSLASSLLGAIEGALAGAITGGIIGALLGEDVPEEHRKKYEEMLHAGHHILVVQGQEDEVLKALELLKDTGELELDVYKEA